MKRVLIALAMIGGSVLMATPAIAQDVPPNNERRITICHRTAAETNPYREITVSANSIIRENGHDTHDGPVFPDEGPDGKWGDIIPEFDYRGPQGTTLHYDGQNLTEEGQAILDNGCRVPGEEDDDDGDDDDGDDGDGDDGDDDGDEKEESLPNTGGGSPWILFTGALLTVLGMAIVNGSSGPLGRHSALAGRHIRI